MSKFKVGDKVRILDGSKIENYSGGWTTKMGRYVGEVYKVANVVHDSIGSSMYEYELEGVGYVWDERGLERCGNETIVIYRKGNEVIALDKRTGKKAIAKCSPEDTFDFNIGAKLAFERLMNGNKESTTVEDMRKQLKNYCSDMHCEDCKLHSPVCRCGNNTHFMTKDNTGNYEMNDEEIKHAFNIVFGTGTNEIKRRAKVGDYVKIVNAVSSYGNYKNGDILQIVDDAYGYARYGNNPGEALYDHEYVVLEGYKPEKEGEPKEPHKFKVGDIVKCNNPVRYCFTDDDMTRCKVTNVSEDGKYISVEILEHKRGSTCKFYGFESNCFDLVEEAPKLYNGKIIFTKGDGIFKTGHIYEVKNGRMSHNLVPTGEPLKDIEDVKDYFTGECDGIRKRKIGWSARTLELMEVKED